MRQSIYIFIFVVFSITSISAQSFNRELLQNEDAMLLGKTNQEKLQQSPYHLWFTENFEEYLPNSGIIRSIDNQLNSYTITIFMGTWCGDSKREVPRFYKILQELNFSTERITLVAVDNRRDFYKQSPGGEHEGLNIHRVPTFIFYKDGKEVNRVIESPKTTLEEDILTILSDKYTSKYSSVTLMNKLLEEKGVPYLTKKAKKMISEFREITQSMYELNTYANVLFYGNKQEEALAILKFNTILFPEEANVYISLANKYLSLNKKTQALAYYKKSLKFTDNEEIRHKIDELKIASNSG